MTSQIRHLSSSSRLGIFFILLPALIFFSAGYSHSEESKTDKRPRIGLVLSGGGARGIAHIGVLKVLEEMHIPIDCIAGTSMGAIVGGLYAAGASPADLEKLVTSIPWNEAFTDKQTADKLSFRRKEDSQAYKIDLNLGIRDGRITTSKGLVQGQNLNLLLKEILLHTADIKDFDKLRIPFRAVAADIETGQAVVIGAGDLSEAIRASMSIPGIFAPMEIRGKMLVDGGIANNLPVDVVRSMGADILIVVDIGTPLRTREGLNSPTSITAQVMTILIQRNVQTQLQTLKPEDILIQPQLGNLGTTDFSKVSEAMNIGQDAAKQFTDRLTRLAVPPENFQVYLARQRQQPVELPKIDYVKVEIKSQIIPADAKIMTPTKGKNADDINLDLSAKLKQMTGIPTIVENRSKVSPKVLEAQIETKAGEKLDLETLNKDINRLYGLDTFERVDFHLAKKDGKTGLIFDPVEKSWGPTYLRFSLSLADDFKGENSYTIGGRITRTEINSLGAEWRNQLQIGDLPRLFSEFYQPLDFGTRYFIAPRIDYREWNANVFDSNSGNVIAEYRIKELLGGLDMGRTFGNWGEFRLGLFRGYGATRLNVGDPTLWPTESFNVGGITSSFSYNTLDDFNFPLRGAAGGAKVISGIPEMGSDNKFAGIDISGLAAKTWGKITVIPKIFYRGVIDGNGEIQDSYTIGGFMNLSGYRPEELSGQHVGLAEIICYRNMGTVGLGDFHTALYLGFSAEAGGAWQNRSDITLSSLIYAGSVFVGANTFIGPAYLAYGFAEGGRQTVGLFIGQRF
ncbi:MAG: patatin-like phospholipase family protein [Deltaproteobacteria bacterium]|nr:patatin-like phospholipase family protein [Deltaproteobacteria bacterium]